MVAGVFPAFGALGTQAAAAASSGKSASVIRKAPRNAIYAVPRVAN